MAFIVGNGPEEDRNLIDTPAIKRQELSDGTRIYWREDGRGPTYILSITDDTEVPYLLERSDIMGTVHRSRTFGEMLEVIGRLLRI